MILLLKYSTIHPINEIIKDIIRQIDDNNDGKISLEEFKLMMEKVLNKNEGIISV